MRKMKIEKQILRDFIGFMIDKWCDEFPYGETCKNCDTEALCENVHMAIEPELYNAKPNIVFPPLMDDDTMGGSGDE